MDDYPVQFAVEYPDRPLNRLTTAFRIFTAIPIVIVLAAISGGQAGGVGLLFLPVLLMLLFREKYPRWWYDWNLQLMRFTNRFFAYLALMSDQYPSTDEPQYVRLEMPYPGTPANVNRWLPLVKWLLAVPHYIVLLFLYLAAIVVVVLSWFAILFTGRYPRSMFEFVQGVLRWHNRVVAYVLVLVTDHYPPFRLSP
ncbi:MAG: DUF4389 domain-containing protein [Candidatus Rokuibacteriota bacterium]|nr:MAG: DUF4389 domain-containing protein [Candidatus Rokubacteria bacterium]